MDNSDNFLLAGFLRKLTTDIESGKTTPSELQKIGEFYMSWKMRQDIDKKLLTEKEIVKYLSTGWYIHNYLK